MFDWHPVPVLMGKCARCWTMLCKPWAVNAAGGSRVKALEQWASARYFALIEQLQGARTA